jgi:hypothetical protein
MRLRFLLLVLPLLALAACSGPGPIVDDPVPPPPPEPMGHPAYETFDPSVYEAAPPERPVETEVQHDVPAALMDGRIYEAPSPTDEPRVLQGYRIQLFSSESKSAADAVRDDATAWWRGVEAEMEEDVFPFGLHPVVVFTRPYYRVRLGAFPSRDEAQPALLALRERYPEAFVVPDTITISRD